MSLLENTAPSNGQTLVSQSTFDAHILKNILNLPICVKSASIFVLPGMFQDIGTFLTQTKQKNK